MKKLILILALTLAILSKNSFAETETITLAPHTGRDIELSFTLENEEQAKEIITALGSVIEQKRIEEAQKVKTKTLSLETMKKVLKSDIFKHLGSKLIKILAIAFVTILINKLIKMAIKITLTGVENQKKMTGRGKQKVNTILPLIENTLNVIFFILSLLIILSELGINIAPLLAGAGVVGLAIGFGAQTIVKDFITGFFIILEGTISKGDVIDISGRSGRVEFLSIKSVVLRDIRGTVHTIPFSEVTTISNKTKDFAFHVFEIGVAYRENTDKVVKEIEKIGQAMYKDEDLSQDLLGKEIEIFGVNELADSAVVIKGRLKTKPGRQWFIGREFNRRIKLSFDKLGIEIPFPHTTIYFGEDKDGNSPNANVMVKK